MGHRSMGQLKWVTNLNGSGHDAKPGYDNARYYAIQITASQFSDKPRDASANVARRCKCEFADTDTSRDTSQNGTRQRQSDHRTSLNVIMKSYTIHRMSTDLGFKVTVLFKAECLKTARVILSN